MCRVVIFWVTLMSNVLCVQSKARHYKQSLSQGKTKTWQGVGRTNAVKIALLALSGQNQGDAASRTVKTLFNRVVA